MLEAQTKGSVHLHVCLTQRTQPSSSLIWLKGRGQMILSQLSWLSLISTGQMFARAISEILHLPHWLNSNIPLCTCFTWHTCPSNGLPLLTGRHKIALPTVNPTRSTSCHGKGMQGLPMGTSHCWKTSRKTAPTHSPQAASMAQPQKNQDLVRRGA